MIALAYNLFGPICAAIIWAAVLYKLRDLRKDPHDLGLRTLCASLTCPAVAFTLAAPWISVRVDHALGIPNVATLLSYGSDVVHTAFAQLLLLVWSYPPNQVWARARWRFVVVGLALAAMIWLFVLAEVPTEQPIDFDSRYATTPYVTELLLVFLGALAVGMAETGRLCWRYARLVDRSWLRRGLWLITIGTGFALGYCACKGAYIGGRLAGKDLHALNTVAPQLGALAVPLLCAGLTLPSWGPRLSAAHTWLGHYRAYRRLYPLWLALYQATPEIALVPTSFGANILPLHDLDFRLYRRVIEIQDGRLRLRPYVVPRARFAARVRAEVAGLTAGELEAVVEAAGLKAALRAKACGSRPTVLPPPSGSAQAHGPVGGSLAQEVSWLVRVAQAFGSSPIVAAVLAEADTAHPQGYVISQFGPPEPSDGG